MHDSGKFEKHLDISSPGLNAASLLADETGLSKTAVKQLMKKGAVWLTTTKGTQRIRRADKALPRGSTLHLYHDESVLQQEPLEAELIADEGDYSVWFKPYGMLCQGSKWGDHCTIYRWVEQHQQPQRSAFIVHRLDRAASGLVLLAHSKKTAAYFSKLFRERKITKVYQAKVEGIWSQPATIDTLLDDKPAVSHVMPLSVDHNLNQSLVRVEIETGRKHQIRRHLAMSGHPIVGDRLYGNGGVEGSENLQLISCYIGFNAPGDGEAKAYRLDDCEPVDDREYVDDSEKAV